MQRIVVGISAPCFCTGLPYEEKRSFSTRKRPPMLSFHIIVWSRQANRERISIMTNHAQQTSVTRSTASSLHLTLVITGQPYGAKPKPQEIFDDEPDHA